ncbi:MAG: LysR family transcriptional regulator [Polyangiaceae bacterium]
MNNVQRPFGAPSFSIEHARALDALVRHGSLQAAARALKKGHPAVLYSLRQLEDLAGLALVDRTGYRLKLTEAGERVLPALRAMLEAERHVRDVVHETKTGWESRLRIVFDGVYPANQLLEVVRELTRDRAPTRLDVIADFLGGVEVAFEREDADLMISVVPVVDQELVVTALSSVRARLVAQANHPLATRRTVRQEDLEGAVLLTVRGSDLRLELSTAALEPKSQVVLNDFIAKKAAILAGIGYGWMPEHLVRDELASGQLKPVRFVGGHVHDFKPKLYRRKARAVGRAGEAVLAALRGKRVDRASGVPARDNPT